jgi:hypothetical protein
VHRKGTGWDCVGWIRLAEDRDQREICWLPEQLSAFQGGLCAMELVTLLAGGDNLELYDFYPSHQMSCVCTHGGGGGGG